MTNYAAMSQSYLLPSGLVNASAGKPFVPPGPYADTNAPLPPGFGDMVPNAGHTEKIMKPGEADVLLGRGRPFQTHSGNVQMLKLVNKYKKRYYAAERQEKHSIVERVLKTVQSRGGRFLCRVDYHHYWVEVTKSIAYRKVGHAFRSTTKPKASKKKGATNDKNPGHEAPEPAKPIQNNRDEEENNATQADSTDNAVDRRQRNNRRPMNNNVKESKPQESAPRPAPAHSTPNIVISGAAATNTPLPTPGGEMYPNTMHPNTLIPPPYPPLPSPQLAMDYNLALGHGVSACGPGAAAGFSSFAGMMPGDPLADGGMFPPLMNYETPAMMHQYHRQRELHQRLRTQHQFLTQQERANQQHNMMSSGATRVGDSNQPTSLLRSEIAELRSELATLRSELAISRRGGGANPRR